VIVLACMVTTPNSSQKNYHEDATVANGFGNLGPEERQFDESWAPRSGTQLTARVILRALTGNSAHTNLQTLAVTDLQ
jgi:hypothetical protein